MKNKLSRLLGNFLTAILAARNMATILEQGTSSQTLLKCEYSSFINY